VAHEISPTARALLALEAIQNAPGINAQRLGERLGVTERAARRYVAILREAGLPIESGTGPYGGYQVGYGIRLPPLTFSAAEAAGLVMAVLEGTGPPPTPPTWWAGRSPRSSGYCLPGLRSSPVPSWIASLAPGRLVPPAHV
jgi:biotin operon repressor